MNAKCNSAQGKTYPIIIQSDLEDLEFYFQKFVPRKYGKTQNMNFGCLTSVKLGSLNAECHFTQGKTYPIIIQSDSGDLEIFFQKFVPTKFGKTQNMICGCLTSVKLSSFNAEFNSPQGKTYPIIIQSDSGDLEFYFQKFVPTKFDKTQNMICGCLTSVKPSSFNAEFNSPQEIAIIIEYVPCRYITQNFE